MRDLFMQVKKKNFSFMLFLMKNIAFFKIG